MSLSRIFESRASSFKPRVALWPLCLLFALTAGGCVDKAADTGDATDSLTDLGDGAGGSGDPDDSDPGSSDPDDSDPGSSDTTSEPAEGTSETSASEDPIETADATEPSDEQPGEPGSSGDPSSAETVDATGEHGTDEASDTTDELGATTGTSIEADASVSTETEAETESDVGTSSEQETRDAGACVAEEETCFPPQLSWTGFTVRKCWGPCPEPDSCFLRHYVSTDGSVTIEEPEGTTETTLSDEDKTALFALLESEEFNTGMQEGFTCPEPPTDVGVSFELARSGVLLEQSVTGCAFGGTGPVQSINAIIDKY